MPIRISRAGIGGGGQLPVPGSSPGLPALAQAKALSDLASGTGRALQSLGNAFEERKRKQAIDETADQAANFQLIQAHVEAAAAEFDEDDLASADAYERFEEQVRLGAQAFVETEPQSEQARKQKERLRPLAEASMNRSLARFRQRADQARAAMLTAEGLEAAQNVVDLEVTYQDFQEYVETIASDPSFNDTRREAFREQARAAAAGRLTSEALLASPAEGAALLEQMREFGLLEYTDRVRLTRDIEGRLGTEGLSESAQLAIQDAQQGLFQRLIGVNPDDAAADPLELRNQQLAIFESEALALAPEMSPLEQAEFRQRISENKVALAQRIDAQFLQFGVQVAQTEAQAELESRMRENLRAPLPALGDAIDNIGLQAAVGQSGITEAERTLAGQAARDRFAERWNAQNPDWARFVMQDRYPLESLSPELQASLKSQAERIVRSEDLATYSEEALSKAGPVNPAFEQKPGDFDSLAAENLARLDDLEFGLYRAQGLRPDERQDAFRQIREQRRALAYQMETREQAREIVSSGKRWVGNISDVAMVDGISRELLMSDEYRTRWIEGTPADRAEYFTRTQVRYGFVPSPMMERIRGEAFNSRDPVEALAALKAIDEIQNNISRLRVYDGERVSGAFESFFSEEELADATVAARLIEQEDPEQVLDYIRRDTTRFQGAWENVREDFVESFEALGPWSNPQDKAETQTEYLEIARYVMERYRNVEAAKRAAGNYVNRRYPSARRASGSVGSSGAIAAGDPTMMVQVPRSRRAAVNLGDGVVNQFLREYPEAAEGIRAGTLTLEQVDRAGRTFVRAVRTDTAEVWTTGAGFFEQLRSRIEGQPTSERAPAMIEWRRDDNETRTFNEMRALERSLESLRTTAWRREKLLTGQWREDLSPRDMRRQIFQPRPDESGMEQLRLDLEDARSEISRRELELRALQERLGMTADEYEVQLRESKKILTGGQ